jgi:HEPN domain-containing protein
MYWVESEFTEQVQLLLGAADERLSDAHAVLDGGSPTGSVYLAGYAVELVLKHAALRVDRASPTSHPLDAIATSRARLKPLLGEIDPMSNHGLLFLAVLLQAAWRYRHSQVPQVVSEAVNRAKKLNKCWSVDLRYQAGLVAQKDALQFVGEARWFVVHAKTLIR